jgi:hypothetical protein
VGARDKFFLKEILEIRWTIVEIHLVFLKIRKKSTFSRLSRSKEPAQPAFRRHDVTV